MWLLSHVAALNYRQMLWIRIQSIDWPLEITAKIGSAGKYERLKSHPTFNFALIIRLDCSLRLYLKVFSNQL